MQKLGSSTFNKIVAMQYIFFHSNANLTVTVDLRRYANQLSCGPKLA